MKNLILVVAGILFLVPTNSEAQKNKKKKPNIIFIMSDDHAYQAISAYDDKLLNTPNIDRLAKEGMLFTNASVTNSICAPSRATILTGKHTHINGKVDNYFPFDTTQVTFPQIFKENGYKTAMFGKLHFGNNPKGVDEFMILPGQGHYINPDFIVTNGDTINKQGYVTDIITEVSLDWLKEEAADDEPFMMMYLHKAPHRPWWPRPDKFKEFTKKTFPEPETLFDDYKNRGSAAKTAEMNLLTHLMYSHDSKIRPETMVKMKGKVFPVVKEFPNSFYASYNRATAAQKALYDPVLDSINDFFYNNWPKMNDTEKMKWKYQRYMQDYLGSISSVDDNVGRLLDYLDESGLAENTIVIYTSDQGFYLGEHGWFDKRFIYDESFKTPLLVRWPNVVKPGSVENEMVQNLDFAQTMLEAVGITPPSDMQGESLIPLLKGEKDKWTRDAVYYQYYEYPSVHMVKRHYGIVNKEFKLVHFYYDVDEWELYDRLNDPNEMNNVYNDPAYAATVKKLKKDLVEMRKYYKDSPEQDQKYIDKYKSAGMIK
ncbi:sulfatase family protein [Maribacter ulvicola]|uniref:Arylsulfatase A n=1 Tax=Maribacter ulvicola TaxID=228959 RepID=A0A1N6Y521_9FLAO|nr:sulfatase [Maribacter ulvicola]SIR09678.1 Arylsulfatase A [Maribacter ulvicola]